MAKTVKMESLSADIADILSQYGEDVARQTAQVVPRVAKRAAAALRASSRETFGSPDGAYRYAKGWRVRTVRGRLGTTAIVHNKTAPGLAHLLEHGHANRDGGRTRGRAHIAPVERTVTERFRRELEELL